MKYKKFLIIFVVILLLITLIVEAIPLIEVNSARAGYTNNASNEGSYLIYEFNDGAIYSYINGTPTLLNQCGVLKVTVERTGIDLSMVIEGPKIINTPNGFEYIQNYSMNEAVSFSSPFVGNFLNQYSLKSGTVLTVDSEVGIVAPPSSNNYCISYSGDNKTLRDYAKGIACTSPSILHFPNFKENGSSTNYPYGNYYQYDQAGGWNVLVSADLVRGTTGTSPFLEQMLNDTNVNKPVLEVTDFSMYLIGTNIDIQPLAIYHYFTEYLPIVIAIWVVGGLYLYVTIRVTKGRSER